MTVKVLQTFTTLATGTEQSGVQSISLSGAGTTYSKEYRELAAFSRARFYLNVSAIGGTSPTLDVTIEEQDPVSLGWVTLVTFPQQTTTSAAPLTQDAASLPGTCFRAKYVLGGTGSPTATCSLCAVAATDEPII